MRVALSHQLIVCPCVRPRLCDERSCHSKGTPVSFLRPSFVTCYLHFIGPRVQTTSAKHYIFMLYKSYKLSHSEKAQKRSVLCV